MSRLLWIMMWWTWGCRYLFDRVILFLLNIYPEVELLDDMVVLFFNILGTSILFSIVTAPIYIPTNNAQGFPFSHILPQYLLYLVFLMIIILSSVRWYFIVVLLYISLTISEHSLVDEYLGCFQFWGIVTKPSMNICVQAFLWTYVFRVFT